MTMASLVNTATDVDFWKEVVMLAENGLLVTIKKATKVWNKF